MRNENYVKFGVVAAIMVLVAMSCTRNISVPVSPNGSTSTQNTPTSTVVNTDTNTPTMTSTNTSLVTSTFTNTPTSTPTLTSTNTSLPGTTNTFTNTPTNTLTATTTSTATNTPTATTTSTATNTPTATAVATVYTLIDDFEQTGGATNPGDDSYNIYQATDQNGHLRDGNWFSSTDGASTAVTNYESTSVYAGTYAGEFSGTLGTQTSYASFGFSFTDPNDTAAPPTGNMGVSFYDATVGGLYTGIVFEIEAKNIVPCTGVQSVIVDLVDITPGGVTTDHPIAVPVTSSYQAVTIFYNQCLSASGTALNPVSMYQVVFKPQSYGDSSYNYDFVVDNISFTSATAPTAATAPGNNVIDNFQNGINDTESPWLVSAGKTPGYLSDFDDATAGTLCPSYTSGAASQPGFCLDIASGAGLPTIVPGVPDFEAHLSDPNIDYGPPSYLGFCGMGFFFDNSQPAGGTDISQGGTYSTLSFYAKSSVSGLTVYVEMNDASTYQDACYAPSVNYYSFTPTAAWTLYTIDFNPSDGTYNLGSPVLTNGTNGCNASTPNSGSAHPYSYTTAEQIQWEPQGSAPKAIDLAVADITLQ